jgi:hypothetical protein
MAKLIFILLGPTNRNGGRSSRRRPNEAGDYAITDRTGPNRELGTDAR